MKDFNYITVVSGLPRSGTSMMMKMLDEGGIEVVTDGERKPDEDNPKGYYEFEKVKSISQDASWLYDAKGKAVKMVSRLLFDLPLEFYYKVIFMKRNLLEILDSQRVMLERNNNEVSLDEQKRIHLYYQKHLNEVVQFLNNVDKIDVLYVSYNDLIKQSHPIIDSINNFLDYRCTIDKMLRVIDPILYRQRKNSINA